MLDAVLLDAVLLELRGRVLELLAERSLHEARVLAAEANDALLAEAEAGECDRL